MCPNILHFIHTYSYSGFFRRRSKKKYDKDNSVVPSATDASGEVIDIVCNDDSESEYDESDDDEEVLKPVP